MKKAVIMCRVSSDEQAKGYSLDVQLEAITNYCQRNDYEVVKEIVVTDQYKHFGSKLVVSGSLGPEMTFRFGSMYSVFKSGRSGFRRIFS